MHERQSRHVRRAQEGRSGLAPAVMEPTGIEPVTSYGTLKMSIFLDRQEALRAVGLERSPPRSDEE
jgi:hypothetical protein